MNVILPPDLQQFVTDQIASGEFDNPGEVICKGLALLREHRGLEEQQLESLCAKIREGLEQLQRGEGIPGEQVFEELRERNRQFVGARAHQPE